MVSQVTIKESYLPIGRAKHSEEEKVFQIYSDMGSNDLLLCDIKLGIDRDQVIIPAHFQRADLIQSIWEHFKSTAEDPMTYLVQGLATDLDTLARFVLYYPLYERGEKLLQQQGVGALARPEEMFFSGVSREGYNGPRFRRIG